jgi:hypothetical protein
VALLVFVFPLHAREIDDCDARFIAFIGSDAYQFSPWLPGELGTVRLFTVLSYQSAPPGRVLWRLEVTGPDGSDRVVFRAHGSGRTADVASVTWDGHDSDGSLVDPGIYRYTFHARYLRFGQNAKRYEEAAVEERDEAYASTGEVVVDYALDATTAQHLRAQTMATSCQVQQNTPLEAGFGYNFYYGSTHSHSNYSDGGQPLTACSSGNAYGSGTFDPAAVYNYARTNAGVDYWLINEHNHLIDDALTTNGTKSEANVKARYASGLTAATNATVSGSFVALYGMEWGVLTNADQGHVTLIETPKLFGWETCTTCTGATAECTPGTNCYFDVYTPKRYGYLTLYQRSVENPSSAGPLGILAHPSSGQFDNFAFNSNADAALQGIAVRSGLAFNTNTSCSTADVATTDYTPQWNAALAKGFHLGPTGDHDSHCDNFGLGLPTRTVYLIRNNVSPVLTKANLLAAHKARHFFATEDPNAQLVFATSDGAHVMGDAFTAGASVTLRVATYDPNGEGVSRIELWRGQIGAAAPTAAYKTWSAVSSASTTESAASGTQYWYYARVVQADGNNVWSAPMWVTFGSGGGTTTQILLNPGFDSGAVNWTSTAGVITNDASFTPQGGTYYAWLNGYGSAHTDSLYQDVAIPSNATAATLKFYQQITTAETTTTTAYDTLKVQVRNTSNTVLATLATYSNLNKTTAWTVRSFDLLAYKGQTIRIYFLGVEDSSLQTSFVIDSTSLNVTQ